MPSSLGESECWGVGCSGAGRAGAPVWRGTDWWLLAPAPPRTEADTDQDRIVPAGTVTCYYSPSYLSPNIDPQTVFHCTPILPTVKKGLLNFWAGLIHRLKLCPKIVLINNMTIYFISQPSLNTCMPYYKQKNATAQEKYQQEPRKAFLGFAGKTKDVPMDLD